MFLVCVCVCVCVCVWNTQSYDMWQSPDNAHPHNELDITACSWYFISIILIAVMSCPFWWISKEHYQVWTQLTEMMSCGPTHITRAHTHYLTLAHDLTGCWYSWGEGTCTSNCAMKTGGSHHIVNHSFFFCFPPPPLPPPLPAHQMLICSEEPLDSPPERLDNLPLARRREVAKKFTYNHGRE